MRDPQDLQFVSFSSSNCGSRVSRSLRDRQTHPAATLMIKPKARSGKIGDRFKGVLCSCLLGLRILSSLSNVTT